VAASILYLAFGDAVAALAGKAFGRHPLPFVSSKTWEGSIACFFTCALVGWGLELGPWRLLAGAFAASVIEAVPIPGNDNFWLPLGSGFALWLI
jgi:dolichol kinase